MYVVLIPMYLVTQQAEGEEGEGGAVDSPPTGGEGRGGGRGGRYRTRIYRRRPDGDQGDQQQPRGPFVSLYSSN